MEFHFFNLLGATLLLAQALLLFFRFYPPPVGLGDVAWPPLLVPLFFAEALFLLRQVGYVCRSRRNPSFPNDPAPSTTRDLWPYLLNVLPVIVTLLLISATVLFAQYIQYGDIPLLSVTITVFVMTLLWLLDAVIRYMYVSPYHTVRQSSVRRARVIAASIGAWQGLFLVALIAPNAELRAGGMWLLFVPTVVFLILSLVLTIRQAHEQRSETVKLFLPIAFAVFVLLLLFELVAIIVHVTYPDLLPPQWIVLPLVVYSGCMVLIFIAFELFVPEYRSWRDGTIRAHNLDQLSDGLVQAGSGLTN